MVLRGGILGRVDDMLLVRGVNVYPPAVDDVLRSFPEVAEYQVEIDTRGAMTELAVRIEPTSADQRRKRPVGPRRIEDSRGIQSSRAGDDLCRRHAAPAGDEVRPLGAEVEDWGLGINFI